MFIVSLSTVCVNQNRFPHNQGAGGNEHKLRKAQRWFLRVSFHLALRPTLPLGGLLLYSTVLFVRRLGIFSQSLHLPLQWHRLPELHSLWKNSHTWLDSLGAQLLSSKLWKCYIQIHLTFNMSFLSCCLKTERAVSEHAIPPVWIFKTHWEPCTCWGLKLLMCRPVPTETASALLEAWNKGNVREAVKS